jgi:hypothetical protein
VVALAEDPAREPGGADRGCATAAAQTQAASGWGITVE